MRCQNPMPLPRGSCVILPTGASYLLRGDRPGGDEEDRGVPFRFHTVQPDLCGRFAYTGGLPKGAGVSPDLYQANIGIVRVIQASAVWGA